MTMQFVVGATPDTDRTILGKVAELYAARRHPSRALQRLPSHPRHADGERARHAGAARASAVSGRLPAARLRLRAATRSCTTTDGNLPLAIDPKTAWALAHPEHFPVEVRTAAREQLLRVPGIGPGERAAHRRRSARARCFAGSRTCARWAWSHARGGLPHARRTPAAERALVRAARLLARRRRGGRAAYQYDVSPGTFR